MVSEQELIDRIKASTGYPDVILAEDQSIDIPAKELLSPRIMVGHLGIKLEDPNDFVADGYHEHDNPEILITSIQFLCYRNELHTVRDNIKKAYSTFSPYPDDSNYSRVTLMEANALAKTSTKIWWQEIVGLVMPRIS